MHRKKLGYSPDAYLEYFLGQIAALHRGWEWTMAYANTQDKYTPILDQISPVGKGKKVIVVGGGAAGAFAAFHLSRLNFEVVVINTGAGRLRTVTDLVKRGEINLGGMRFPESHKFVKDAIDSIGLKCDQEEFVNHNPNGLLHLRGQTASFRTHSNLAALYDSEHIEPKVVFSETMSRVLNELGAREGDLAIEETLRGGHKYGYQTLREYLLLQGYSNDQIAYIGHINSVYQYIDTPIGELAIDYHSLYGSRAYYRLKNGLVSLPQRLLQKTNASIIEESTVTEISADRQVRVKYQTREGVRMVVADYILMTIPAPMLDRILWHTPLPILQQEAFREIGYANSSKTLIEATEPFWLSAGIDGGRNWTDLGIQQSVFPKGIQRGERSVFTASYTWQHSARRMMAIQHGEERFELIADQLEVLHPGARRYLASYEHIDWDSEAGGGAFAYYSPGDYQRFHAWLSTPYPSNDPKVFFSGEAVGLHHGWAESALQSTQWAILQLLDAMA